MTKIGATWVFLPVDHVCGLKNVPQFFSVLGVKQTKALEDAGIQSVHISQDEAQQKVSYYGLSSYY